MNYENMTLNEIARLAHRNAKDKGFCDPAPTVGEHLALIHSEVSEALEAFRERGLNGWYRDNGKPEGIASELADAIIRIGHMAAAFGLDLESAVAEKMAFNSTRSYRHGNKKL